MRRQRHQTSCAQDSTTTPWRQASCQRGESVTLVATDAQLPAIVGHHYQAGLGPVGVVAGAATDIPVEQPNAAIQSIRPCQPSAACVTRIAHGVMLHADRVAVADSWCGRAVVTAQTTATFAVQSQAPRAGESRGCTARRLPCPAGVTRLIDPPIARPPQMGAPHCRAVGGKPVVLNPGMALGAEHRAWSGSAQQRLATVGGQGVRRAVSGLMACKAGHPPINKRQMAGNPPTGHEVDRMGKVTVNRVAFVTSRRESFAS